MKKQNRQKGITLVALIITIIILLILAGISIVSLTQTRLFEKAQESKERTIKAQLKEEIEMAIQEIQIEEISKGNNMTLEAITSKLENKLNGITAEFDNNEITGEYKSHTYKIDSNLKVTIEDKVEGISFGYELEPKGYTNGNIKLKITASSTNGTITSIQAPSELTLNEDGTYIVNKNGTYSFEIIDESNVAVKKDIVINNIDKLEPEECQITINKNFGTKILVNVNAKDADATQENAQSGIEKYKYFIKKESEADYQEYTSNESSYIFTGLDTETQYNIYVIAYDKAGNYKESNHLNETTKSEALSQVIITDKGIFNSQNLETGEYYINPDITVGKIPTELYDGRETSLSLYYSDVRYIEVDESAIGKTFWVKGYRGGGNYSVAFIFYHFNNEGQGRTEISRHLWKDPYSNTQIVESVIPKGTSKIMVGNYQSNTTGVYLQIGVK